MASTPPNPQQMTVVDIIAWKLNDLFGGDPQQQFAMEFPGRVLDPATYTYPIDNEYSVLTKPQIVVEEEFRLTDDLYDLAGVVGGPNGDTLSTAYDLALNSLVPLVTDEQAQFMTDRQTIRAWLLSPVTATVKQPDGTEQTVTMTRIDLYDYLNARYTSAAAKWRDTKNARFLAAESAKDQEQALDEYARWLAIEAPVQEAELEAMFGDVVVQGYYHEVREMLGFLDIKSPAELLDQAKASLRASGMSSLDETETVYPVQLQPVNWFTSLAPETSPVDLLLDPMALTQELVTLQNQLAQVQEQYTLMTAQQTGDPAAIEQQVQAAQQTLDTASTTLNAKYLDSVISVAKIYLKSQETVPTTTTGLENALNGAGLSNLFDPTTLSELQNDTLAVNNAQQQLTAASRQLADLQTAEAAAQATDASGSLTAMQTQMTQLETQIQGLQALLDSSSATQVLQTAATSTDTSFTIDPTKTPGFQNVVTSGNLLPPTQPSSGNWMSVTMTFEAGQTSSKSSMTASSSVTSDSVGLFLASESGSYSTSQSTSASQVTSDQLNIAIGMYCTKVTIDRGGWFDADILGDLAPFCHIDGSKISDGNGGGDLPSYPVAFIVVKDVTIQVSKASSDQGAFASVASSASSTSGGFLCFNVSHSTSSRSSSKSFYSASSATDLVIKIPQPQILGWFLERVPADTAPQYTGPLPADFLPAAPPTPPVTPSVNGAATDGQAADRVIALSPPAPAVPEPALS